MAWFNWKSMFKVIAAVLLVTFLVRSDRLHFKEVLILTHNWKLLTATIVGWLVIFGFLQSYRWWILLRGLGIEAQYFSVFKLTLIGLFFNSTMPGAVGGDVIKAYYIIREQSLQNKSEAMITILLDRIVGLIALILVATIGFCLSPDIFLKSTALMYIVGLCLLAVCASGLLFAFLFSRAAWVESLCTKLTAPREGLLKIPSKIFAALFAFRKNPYALVQGVIISLVVQILLMLFFYTITETLNDTVISLPEFAPIYAAALFVTALPISPSGIGVGHVAFEKLYQLGGMDNGANVFNIYMITSILLNLTGIIPYLTMRKSLPQPDSSQMEGLS